MRSPLFAALVLVAGAVGPVAAESGVIVPGEARVIVVAGAESWRAAAEGAPGAHTPGMGEVGSVSQSATGAVCGVDACANATPGFWLSASVLRWQVKDGPMPFPLVTTGDRNDPFAGVVGQPGTRVLFGGDGIDFNEQIGYRLTAGAWLDQGVGGEVGFFILEPNTPRFATGTDVFPGLYIGEGRLVVGDPVTQTTGNVIITPRTRLWGAEVNGLYRTAAGGTELTLLAGLRYLDLNESLRLESEIAAFGGFEPTFFRDEFDTKNRFLGAQIGGRLAQQYGKFFGELTGKVAIGCTQQVVDVTGSSVFTDPFSCAAVRSRPGSSRRRPTSAAGAGMSFRSCRS